MKKITLITALLLLGACGAGSAWADPHGGHGGYHRGYVGFGVMVGPYWGGPWYYPPYGYYYPPYYSQYPQLVAPGPQVYVEQQPAPEPAPAPPVAAAPANYWYYCAKPKGYYPYVRECPGGWQQVLPQPPGQP